MPEAADGACRQVAFLLAHMHKGGMQKAVSNISCALPPSIRQHVLYFGTEDPGFAYRGTQINLNVPGRMDSGTPARLANLLRRRTLLRNAIRTNGIETLASFGEAANLMNCLTPGKRTVLSVRVSIDEGLTDTGRYRSVYRTLVRTLYRRADAVVAVSAALKQQLISAYAVPAEKIQVIYNLYNIAEIEALAEAALPAAMESVFRKPVVLNVGSLIHQKGQEFLIRGFAMARRQAPQVQLVIVGRGEREAALSELARQLGVAEAVHFAGFDPNPYRFMARAGMFVLSSRFEGFPNVLAEAMICGAPVAALDCPTGPREILGDSEYGMLLPGIDERDPQRATQAICDAILKMLSPELGRIYRQQARKRAADFSHERIINRWVEVL